MAFPGAEPALKLRVEKFTALLTLPFTPVLARLIRNAADVSSARAMNGSIAASVSRVPVGGLAAHSTRAVSRHVE